MSILARRAGQLGQANGRHTLPLQIHVEPTYLQAEVRRPSVFCGCHSLGGEASDDCTALPLQFRVGRYNVTNHHPPVQRRDKQIEREVSVKVFR